MNKFFDLIDKYKYGVIAAFASAIGIFVYLQLTSVHEYFEITAFATEPQVEIVKEEELLLTAENIEIPPQFEAGKVLNDVRDMNDKRERSEDRSQQSSNEDYKSHKSMEDVDKSVKDYERQMFEEAGGEAKRKAIKEADEKRKKDQKSTSSDKPDKANSDNPPPPKGNVMVDYELDNRSPFQNNKWYVQNPGYKCGHGAAGRIVVSIKVGKDGRVISAVFDAAGSTTNNSCMVSEAITYAKKSRFDYSGSAPESQSGKIYYTFVSQ